jgi:hypothetical protein
MIPATASGASSGPQVFRLRDRCEPRSFNAAVGDEICTGNGDVTFDQFIAEVEKKHEHGAWNLSPEQVTVQAGTPLRIRNEGGEVHTFTKVARFGGGFVDILNELSRNPVPRPACARKAADGTLVPRAPSATNLFLPGGARATVSTGAGTKVTSGLNRFQCCLHPWMRTRVSVTN